MTVTHSFSPIGFIATFNPPSGDGSGERNGNKVLMKWIKVRIRIETSE